MMVYAESHSAFLLVCDIKVHPCQSSTRHFPYLGKRKSSATKLDILSPEESEEDKDSAEDLDEETRNTKNTGKTTTTKKTKTTPKYSLISTNSTCSTDSMYSTTPRVSTPPRDMEAAMG